MNERDRDFILNPNEWPMIALPLKRKNPFQPENTAVFIPPLSVKKINPDAPIEIRIGTIYDELSELPRKKYDNVDALLADGWMVD